MDVGHSLNPAIDIGQVWIIGRLTSISKVAYCSAPFSSDLSPQVEGAFMQGLGLFTLEELHYSPRGVLLTRGPGSYKIPAFGDIPTHLTVSLLRDAPNDKAIFASKVLTVNRLQPSGQKRNKKGINNKSFFRRWASLLCFWQRPSSSPSRMPSAPLVQSRASVGPSASTARPRRRGSGTRAPTSSPN